MIAFLNVCFGSEWFKDLSYHLDGHLSFPLKSDSFYSHYASMYDLHTALPNTKSFIVPKEIKKVVHFFRKLQAIGCLYSLESILQSHSKTLGRILCNQVTKAHWFTTKTRNQFWFILTFCSWWKAFLWRPKRMTYQPYSLFIYHK